MKTHYSCAELAAMKLPGYPVSKKGWYTLVQRDSWDFQGVPGKGGKGGIRREYLPPAKISRLIAIRPVMEARGTGSEVTLTLTVSLAEATHITRWLEKKARA